MSKYVRLRPGARVIRGPDWQSKNLDGGEGYVGTIVYVPKEGSSSDKVTVIWDSGRELRYRAGVDGKYDLCLLDNSPTGVKHPNITCDECQENPLIGSRWKCSTCTDFDLCTTCYMSGKHDVSHSFMRMDYEKATVYGVPPRQNSKPKPVYGIFKGATVMRGPHWKWKNDDGGPDEEGKVLAVTDWKKDSPRGGVKIKWAATKKAGEYRVGGEGCVDVVYTEEGEGPIKYYFDHLPLVDVINSGDIVLKKSDKVRVNLQEKEFKQMQDNDVYGGWSDGMKQCLQELGTIVDMLFRGETIQLQYEDAKKWVVNRRCLTRVHSFSIGEAVTILGDVNAVKDLQEGHGGWNSDMNSSLGKAGRIVRIADDGDLRVKVEGRTWIYSPVCCLPVADVSQAKNVPQLSKTEMNRGNQLDDLELMKKDMDKVAGAVADLFVGLLRAMPALDNDEMLLVEACVKGDLDTVKRIVDRSPEKVNARHEHKTGLQMACYQGHVEIVQYLLSKNADVHLTDEEKDTAVHFAAFGEEEKPLDLLLKKGAKTDVKNKNGLTPLHVAVGKGSHACTKVLIGHGASVNIKDDDGDTPMHDCIVQKKNQSLLIREVYNANGADFAVQNQRSFNVLHWATLKNCKEAADIVIAKRPDMVDSRMNEGFTALHICAANDRTDIASSLLKAKANTNAVDKNKRTPLHVAVTQSHKKVIELFLEAGCEINAQDEYGNTPLHVAQMRHALPNAVACLLGVKEEADNVTIQISCLLLEAKADVEIKNKDGKSPLDLCNDFATKEFMKRLAGQVRRKSFESSVKGHMLPTHWDRMDSESVMRVHLDTSDGRLNKEYQGVQSNFMKTLPQARIFRIERVQNKYSWEHYFLMRRKFEAVYGKADTNEMELYHGTNAEYVDEICEKNLDHRLAGKTTGKMYGQGSYFAKNAKYSDKYSSADKDGFKYMFQCRVLAGKWTIGDPSYKRPPGQKDQPSKLYDCCVDDEMNPEIFCLFDNNQCYPEYVIQYQ